MYINATENRKSQLIGGINISFDEVFKIWMDSEMVEVSGRDLLKIANDKGFDSVYEWRMATALRLGMDNKQWQIYFISDPNEFLPNVLMGPYQGWQRLMPKKLTASFADALKVPEFYDWFKMHDRVQSIARNFPIPTTVILFRLQSGQYLHVEGGHRICAVAFKVHEGQPIHFSENSVQAAAADITDSEFQQLFVFLRQGTGKQKTP